MRATLATWFRSGLRRCGVARPGRGSRVKIPNYRVKHGKAYWQPNPTGRDPNTKRPIYPKGLEPRPLGPAGAKAENMALTLYRALDKIRRGGVAHLQDNRQRWPRGSLGEAFERYRLTREWAKKAVRTREDWERA